jgi:hypothetical protein
MTPPPDAPGSETKTVVPPAVAPVTATASTPTTLRTAPARPKGRAPDPDLSEADDEASPAPRKASPWTLVFAATSVALVGVAVLLWMLAGKRGQEIETTRNRTEQIEAGAAARQSELDEAKAVSTRMQRRLDENRTAANVQAAALDKAKAEAADLHDQLAALRLKSGAFQAQAEQANVASLKRQGEVEVAQAATTVARAESIKARADLSQMEARFNEARAQADTLQASLAKAETELSELKKVAARK